MVTNGENALIFEQLILSIIEISLTENLYVNIGA